MVASVEVGSTGKRKIRSGLGYQDTGKYTAGGKPDCLETAASGFVEGEGDEK